MGRKSTELGLPVWAAVAESSPVVHHQPYCCYQKVITAVSTFAVQRLCTLPGKKAALLLPMLLKGDVPEFFFPTRAKPTYLSLRVAARQLRHANTERTVRGVRLLHRPRALHQQPVAYTRDRPQHGG